MPAKTPEAIARMKERKKAYYNKQKAAKRGPAPVLVGKMRSTVARSERPKPKDERPVVIPSHVRVQVCPSSKDTRYSVPAGFVGEFSKQWRELRSHTKGQA